MTQPTAFDRPMTVTKLRQRLELLESQGRGDQPVILRADRWKNDRRHRCGFRTENLIVNVTAACTGALLLDDNAAYTELRGALREDWR